MLVLPRDIGGTIRVRAPRRPDAAPTVEILTKSGGAKVAAGTAATLSTASTTLNGAHADKVSVLTLVSTTGMAAGDEIVLGTSYRPTDFVLVSSVDSATQVTLVHPTMRAYATGVAVVGTYISYTIAAASLDVSERDWQARFTWAFGAVTQPTLIVRFDVSRYAAAYGPPTLTGSPYPTINDIRLHDPLIRDKLATTFDYEQAIQRAVSEVVRDLNAGQDASALVHDDDFRELAALKFLADFAGPTMGPDKSEQRDAWVARYKDRFAAIASQIASDADADNAIEEHEKGGFTGWAYRA